MAVDAAPKRAIEEDARQTEYLGFPVVVPGRAAADVRVESSVSLVGPVEAGVIARWRHDEAYALLVRRDEALLCRYSVKDRRDFQRKALKVDGASSGRPSLTLSLTVIGGRVAGRVTGSGIDMRLEGRDPEPLPGGAAGVVVNPRSSERGGRAEFGAFELSARDEPAPLVPSFIYRYAGGVVEGSTGAAVRLAARCVVPAPVGFEVSTDDGFDDPLVIGPEEPQGKWGSVRAWARDLSPGTTYHWRAFSGAGEERVYSRPATFRTPAPDRPVRFAFGSCTSGRTTDYSSFATAASIEPDFYLHAGDVAYPNLNSLRHGPDHFQSRWSRLLRVPEMRPLLDRSPLMFWQDDHDYQADNGWSGTCKPYAVWAFDEFHANPTDVYFDVRWGDVHIWCLDCRLYATDPAAPDGPGKSRIGADQKKWLVDGMAASDAPVRVVASGMAFRNKVDDDPGWHNVYTYERDELLKLFSELPATVFILSGDSHGHRLIHHFEFGDLFEITASGTDFPPTAFWWQGNHDPEHTLVNIDKRTGFAIVEVGPPGPARTVTIKSIASDNGEVLFQKVLPVAG